MDANVIEPNYLLSLMSGILDPKEFYENFALLSGIAAVGPWFYVLFIAMRFARESMDGITGQAALFKAFGSIKTSLLVFLGWSSIGFVVFELIFGLSELFEGWGSQQLIHKELLDAKTQMIKEQPEAYEDFMVTILKGVAFVPSLFSAGVWWTVYQGMSMIYVLFNQAYSVLFAIAVGLTYIWGFVAIPTQVLKGEMNLTRGWGLALFSLFIWAILEPILLGFLWFTLNGAELVLSVASGGKVTAVIGWYVYSIIMMAAVIAIKIFVIFAAHALAKNDSPMGSLGAIAAAPTMMMVNNLMSQVQKMGQGMMPDSAGGRTRDRMANAMGADVRDMAGAAGRSLSRTGDTIKSGMGNLASNVTERFSGQRGAESAAPSFPSEGARSGGGLSDIDNSTVAQGVAPTAQLEGGGSAMGSLADHDGGSHA